MKKHLLLILLSLLLVLFTVSCRKVPVTDLLLNRDSLTLAVGDTGILFVTILPEDATYKRLLWSSSNPDVVATVNGVLIALNEGEAIIHITTKEGAKTVSCNLKVNKKTEEEPEMVIIKGGRFPMGCTDNDCLPDDSEKPWHLVTVSSFQISKYPITQKQWKVIMGTIPESYAGDNFPVVHVSWEDAQEFIAKLNTVTGKNYRLPTEAEWEFVARGGTKSKGYKYSGSNDFNAVAWNKFNSGQKTHPVGMKAPNELGIYDMSGNVWELCNDWYGRYHNDEQTDPQGPGGGTWRVLRGGSWAADSVLCRISARSTFLPIQRTPYTGFRVAHSL